jgi:cytochrome c oxidase subunit 4
MRIALKLAAVYVALIALLGATYAVSFVDLGGANFWINLAIAAAKTALVALFFMRVATTPLARSVAVTAIAFLTILYWLSADDYLTRARSDAPDPHVVLGPARDDRR